MKRIVFALLVLCACDERQALHLPEATLARMQDQPRADPFEGMREPPQFTVARGSLPHPQPKTTRALLTRGRARFDATCATCHGVLGDGQSPVAAKMLLRPPPSLHEARIVAFDAERMHDVIVRGYGLMPSYAWQLPGDDAWAVAAYVRALQLSRNARVADLPPQLRAELAKEAP